MVWFLSIFFFFFFSPFCEPSSGLGRLESSFFFLSFFFPPDEREGILGWRSWRGEMGEVERECVYFLFFYLCGGLGVMRKGGRGGGGGLVGSRYIFDELDGLEFFFFVEGGKGEGREEKRLSHEVL